MTKGINKANSIRFEQRRFAARHEEMTSIHRL
jgi:hypothetical protein